MVKNVLRIFRASFDLTQPACKELKLASDLETMPSILHPRSMISNLRSILYPNLTIRTMID